MHLFLPALSALIFFRGNFWKAWIIMMLTMLVDIDHLLADPIFDPDRCSIGFHPLHSYIATGIYFVMLIPPRTRIIGTGLVLHMVTDFTDCMMSGTF
jgi:hypothetical protein